MLKVSIYSSETAAKIFFNFYLCKKLINLSTSEANNNDRGAHDNRRTNSINCLSGNSEFDVDNNDPNFDRDEHVDESKDLVIHSYSNE